MNRLEIFQKVYGTDHVFTVQELERLRQVTELIVRECENVELYWLSLADRTSVFEKIRQHFGVEE